MDKLPDDTSGADLDLVAKLKPQEQADAITRMDKLGESVAEAYHFIRGEEKSKDQIAFERIKKTWNANAAGQELFFEWLRNSGHPSVTKC